MTYQCEVRQFEPQATLTVRVRAPAHEVPQLMGRWFGAIGKYLMELHQPPTGMPYAAYRNMDAQDMDVEIGFPVGEVLPPKGEIQPGSIPGGRMATTIHFGPYDRLEDAYHALQSFVGEQGLEPTGVLYEMYMNDPIQVAPEEVQTLVTMPLK